MCAVLHHWCVMAFRDRVIHLLAVRAYKRPELILRLQNGMYVACCSSTMSQKVIFLPSLLSFQLAILELCSYART